VAGVRRRSDGRSAELVGVAAPLARAIYRQEAMLVPEEPDGTPGVEIVRGMPPLVFLDARSLVDPQGGRICYRQGVLLPILLFAVLVAAAGMLLWSAAKLAFLVGWAVLRLAARPICAGVRRYGAALRDAKVHP
jgi:hypothetical protein